MELIDGSGAKQQIVPDQLTYTVGGEVGEQPLINSIGVVRQNNEVAWFFEKGSGLPLKKKSPYPFHTTDAVLVSSGGGLEALVIPVVEGENELGDRNHVTGKLVVTADSIKRDLPAGSEVEITLKVDESRIITLLAYVPVLDEEFEVKFHPRQKTVIAKDLGLDHEAVLKRVASLLEQAKKANDREAIAELEKLKLSPLVRELEELVTAAKGDPDAANKGESRLLDLRLALDAIENPMRWPTLVGEARTWLNDMDRVVNGTGRTDLQARASQLRSDVEGIIEKKEMDRLARKIKEVGSLFYFALGLLPQTWVNEFQRLSRMQDKFTDKARAQHLLNVGQSHLTQNNIDGLKNCCHSLWELLPKQEVVAARQAFGSTIG